MRRALRSECLSPFDLTATRLAVFFALALLIPLTAFAQDRKQSSDPADPCDAMVAGVEHGDALADACRFALSLRHKLPNVICDQKTSRYRRGPNYPQRLEDVVTAHVIYEDGMERYSDVKVDGEIASEEDAKVFGEYTTGEFGSDLVFAFWPANHASYTFVRKDRIGSHKVLVYAAKVTHENNHGWKMDSGNQQSYPEFNATIWLDRDTHQVVRLDVVPVPEKEFPIFNPYIRTEYKLMSLGDGTSFVLPVQSQSGSCLWNNDRRHLAFCNVNVLSFNNCHKFSAKSHIITDLNKAVK